MTVSEEQNTAPRSFVAVPGRPEAAAVAWRSASVGGAREPLDGRGRIAAQTAVAALVGASIAVFGSRALGIALLSIAALVFTAAMISPRTVSNALGGLFASTGRIAGTGLTWLLMVPLFYLFFLPFGALLRRGRRDRLQRFTDVGAPTYWDAHEGPRAGSQHPDRQY